MNAGRMTPTHPARSPALSVDPSVVAQASENSWCDIKSLDALPKGVDDATAAG